MSFWITLVLKETVERYEPGRLGSDLPGALHQLRRVFSEFFIERGDASVPSAGLIPHHPKAPLFTNAGMNQFLPYFLGEEATPYPRATSVQKCVRIMSKPDDIENIGRSRRHVT